MGKVPRKGVYDGEPAISVRRGRRLIYTHDYLRLKGTLGMGSIVLAKGHPERKGIVERTNGYLETSFMPGRVSADRDDFNTQLGDWLEHKANVGVHSGLRCRPSERIDEDLAAMMALPPVLRRHGRPPRPAPARRSLGCAIRPTTTRCTPRRSGGGCTSGSTTPP